MSEKDVHYNSFNINAWKNEQSKQGLKFLSTAFFGWSGLKWLKKKKTEWSCFIH